MKSIGGFYYVRADGEDYECKARGSFRKSGNSPVAGDRVNISVPNDGFCAIEEILPRKNKLRRPALANLDILLLVCGIEVLHLLGSDVMLFKEHRKLDRLFYGTAGM